MRVRTPIGTVLAAGLLLGPGTASAAPPPADARADVGAAERAALDGVDPGWLTLAREVLPDGDGWASVGPGTTGGSAATAERVHVVRTWDELRAALGGATAHQQTEPRIVLVEGTIRAFGLDDPASPLPTCDDLAAAVTVEDEDGARPFSMAEYVAAYDPDVWGWTEPTGPLEEARARAAAGQRQLVQQRIGSNVTVLGVGDDARVVGAHLQVQGVSNVILRNLHVSDAYDCFPEWDPLDGSRGNWNSLYDNVSVHSSTHVWVDRLTLDDGDHPPHTLPTVFGRPFEVHDGLLDVTHEADLVTVSRTVFRDHDKTNLVGSGDGRGELDGGKLRSTWHHNLWDDAGQRAPRVRFGDVDLYNNYHRVSAERAGLFDYVWGVGVESSIYAEKNAIDLPDGVPASRVVKGWGGTQLHAAETLVNGVELDVLAAYNATAGAGAQLAAGARWDPVALGLRGEVHDVRQVRDVVLAEAGAGRLVPAVEEPAPEPEPTLPVLPPGGPGGGDGGAAVVPPDGPGGPGGPGGGGDEGDAVADGAGAAPGGPLAVTGAGVGLALAAALALLGGGLLLRRAARARSGGAAGGGGAVT